MALELIAGSYHLGTIAAMVRHGENEVSKTLFTLCVHYGDKSLPIYFETLEGLLAGRTAISAAGRDVSVDEDPAIRVLFETPAKAASHVRLWVESLAPPVAPDVSPVKAAASAEDVLPSGLTHKEEVLHMLLRDGGVTLNQIMQRYGILRDSASALISTTCSKFGYTSHRSDEGVYTATKGRADGRGMKKATVPAKAKAEPRVHVLGRGRRVAEPRAH